ncbi:MAG: GntR family transcriptional regulator [Longicatena sp.]
MKFDSNIPIYLQIIDEFKRNIINKTYLPGSKVKAVRELAVEFGVNPNTVQRALVELERMHLVHANRTVGRFISEEEDVLIALKKDLVHTKVNAFVCELKEYGYSEDEILELIQTCFKDND